MSKKVVLKLHIYDDKEKQKALKTVSSIPGIESIAMDMTEKKLTVVGDMDPIQLVGKLRKLWATDVLTVGPAKEPDKKEDDAIKEDEQKKMEFKRMAELLRLYENNYYNVSPP